MGQIINWDHYRTASLLISTLREGAEDHVGRMEAHMARRRNSQGEDFWRAIGSALAELRRKNVRICRASPF